MVKVDSGPISLSSVFVGLGFVGLVGFGLVSLLVVSVRGLSGVDLIVIVGGLSGERVIFWPLVVKVVFFFTAESVKVELSMITITPGAELPCFFLDLGSPAVITKGSSGAIVIVWPRVANVVSLVTGGMVMLDFPTTTTFEVGDGFPS